MDERRSARRDHSLLITPRVPQPSRVGVSGKHYEALTEEVLRRVRSDDHAKAVDAERAGAGCGVAGCAG